MIERKKGVPRHWSTYRGARRNTVLHPIDGKPGVWHGVATKPARYVPHMLNRSKHWKFASSYEEARTIAWAIPNVERRIVR
jgi:hypothetical protein